MLRHWSCDCVAKMLLLPFVWTNDVPRDTTKAIRISGRKLQTQQDKVTKLHKYVAGIEINNLLRDGCGLTVGTKQKVPEQEGQE